MPEAPDFGIEQILTTATPYVQTELMRFVDSLKQEGETVYRGGISEALSRLSSQDPEEQHDSKSHR